jgi:hypothetical protein
LALGAFGGRISPPFQSPPTILDELLDTSKTDFSGPPDYFPYTHPDDLIYAAEFDFTGVSNSVLMTDTITALAVPEPGTLMLLGAGFACMAAARKASRKRDRGRTACGGKAAFPGCRWRR